MCADTGISPTKPRHLLPRGPQRAKQPGPAPSPRCPSPFLGPLSFCTSRMATLAGITARLTPTEGASDLGTELPVPVPVPCPGSEASRLIDATGARPGRAGVGAWRPHTSRRTCPGSCDVTHSTPPPPLPGQRSVALLFGPREGGASWNAFHAWGEREGQALPSASLSRDVGKTCVSVPVDLTPRTSEALSGRGLAERPPRRPGPEPPDSSATRPRGVRASRRAV